MDEKINHPFASFFELVMSLPSEGRKLLQYFADPKLVKTLDLDTLNIAKGAYKGGKTGLSNLYTDTLYNCKCQDEEIFINLLFEHKSYLENPKAQILTYLMTAYHEQKSIWTNTRAALRKANKQVPYEVFQHTPIIAILFYHGEKKWQDYKFSDQFNLPKKWMGSYIPDVKIFVINMADFSDEDIEKIGPSFLQPMLYMFKHKGDKNFLLQNIEKIFKFVGDLKMNRFVKDFLKTVFFFMIQTFKLKDKDVEQVVKHLPFENSTHMDAVQETVVTVIDEAVQRGLLQGIGIGEKKGEVKGK